MRSCVPIPHRAPRVGDVDSLLTLIAALKTPTRTSSPNTSTTPKHPPRPPRSAHMRWPGVSPHPAVLADAFTHTAGFCGLCAVAAATIAFGRSGSVYSSAPSGRHGQPGGDAAPPGEPLRLVGRQGRQRPSGLPRRPVLAQMVSPMSRLRTCTVRPSGPQAGSSSQVAGLLTPHCGIVVRQGVGFGPTGSQPETPQKRGDPVCKSRRPSGRSSRESPAFYRDGGAARHGRPLRFWAQARDSAASSSGSVRTSGP